MDYYNILKVEDGDVTSTKWKLKKFVCLWKQIFKASSDLIRAKPGPKSVFLASKVLLELIKWTLWELHLLNHIQLFHNIQIFKLKIFPHILFSEKRNNGSIHISFKTLKYISSENWKSKIILLFDKLMWAFLHLHYSTSFKRDLWIKDYFGERHIQLEYFYRKRFLLLNQSISRAEFEELKLVSKT